MLDKWGLDWHDTVWENTASLNAIQLLGWELLDDKPSNGRRPKLRPVVKVNLNAGRQAGKATIVIRNDPKWMRAKKRLIAEEREKSGEGEQGRGRAQQMMLLHLIIIPPNSRLRASRHLTQWVWGCPHSRGSQHNEKASADKPIWLLIPA